MDGSGGLLDHKDSSAQLRADAPSRILPQGRCSACFPLPPASWNASCPSKMLQLAPACVELLTGIETRSHTL